MVCTDVCVTCRLRWVGHAALMGDRVLVGKCCGKRSLQIPWYRREANIKMNPEDIQWDNIYWINLAWGRYKWCSLLNMIMKLCVP